MTVGELIEKLKEFDSSKKVYILSTDDSPLSGGFDIDNVLEVNGSNKELDNAVYIVEA